MNRLLYYIMYPYFWISSLTPMWWLYFKSDILYFFVYYVFSYRKKVVVENLKLIYPEKNTSEINNISKRFFAHFCDIIAETIKSITISEKEIRKRFQVTNIEHLKPFYESNKSILLMAGHYANWEWSGILNKMIEHQAHAVYKPLRNKQMDTVVKKIRERFGGVIVSNKQVVPKLYRNKKKNIKTLTYILSDQSPKEGHYKHRDTFMGINVPVFTGAEEVAKKLDFSVLYLHVEKVKRGFYNVTFKTIAEDAKAFKDYEITRKFYDLLENQIKESPYLYLWSHRRWKLRH